MNWYKTANLDAQWINAFAMAFSLADQSFGHFQQIRYSSRPGGVITDLVFGNLREMTAKRVPPCTVRLEINAQTELIRYQVQMGNKLLEANSVSAAGKLVPQVASTIVNSAMSLFKTNAPTSGQSNPSV